MENCCDGALYPLGLEPLERPVGLQLCSHLFDKEAGWGRVLPDVVVMFQAVPQSLIPLSCATCAHVLLDWGCCGCVLALSGYHSNVFARLASFFHLISTWWKATKPLQFRADPCSVC